MKTLKYILVTGALLALTVQIAAASDASDLEAGKKGFKKCIACHALEKGKKKVGPDLFNIIGRKAGAGENYKYSKDMAEAGKKGLVWDADSLTAYLEDPKKFVGQFLKKGKAKIKMANKFKKLKFRQNLVSYLQSLQEEKK